MIWLIGRLAVRDLRRRRGEAMLLFVALLAATTTLTLGLVLRDAASDPYERTRAATAGPDVVATGTEAQLRGLTDGVTARSGPFPAAGATLRLSGRTSDVQAIGRDSAAASVDRPEVRRGTWVRAGGVVVEGAFADAFGVRVGDSVTVDGRSFDVVGIAVSAAMAPYPGGSCLVPCAHGTATDLPPEVLRNPGLIWLTRADLESIGADVYVMNLRLADPSRADAYVAAHLAPPPGGMGLESWQTVLAGATELAGDTRILLLIGAWLLGLLAVAGLSVLVGGRMADQTRRVGLLKAVGGTPRMVAAVLLAQYLLVALIAAVAGLALGALLAPLLAGSTAGLLGSAGTPSITLATAGIVVAVALGVAVLATFVPAVRAARRSTVVALADSARAPRRTGWVIAASARLPVPLLLAVRVAGRRPRRVVLAVVSVAITVSGVFVALVLDAFLTGAPMAAGYDVAQVGQLRRVLLVVMGTLAVLAAVNTIVLAWVTVLDNRRSSALARALGASPAQVSVGLAAAQVLPAVLGAVLGIFPGGVLLFAALMTITGGDSSRATFPGGWQLLALVVLSGVAVAALTAVPAGLAARRTVGAALRAA
ncbi:FtsX-like permease family protein [Cryptosporangium sp. NPDC051539]|uniref:FtsX-like permease family protein n=1 Tax=Cryptosporangium sp. NPDC051539 TaxID=3363962 RepID=UPI0037946812